MREYPVLCQVPGCGAAARHKIAARWSDGFTHEFKTYALTCAACLAAEFARAAEKQRACRLALGETLAPVEVFGR